MTRRKAVVREDGKVYVSTQEAAKDVLGDPTDIAAACRGKRKTAYGHRWRYAEEDEARKADE